MYKVHPNDSCTSFCLEINGFAVFGANFDHGTVHEGLIFTNKRGVEKTYWEKDISSTHARWTSKFGSVTFNLVMHQISWGGMNEEGLVISTMEMIGSRSPTPDRRSWIYANYWVQYILDNFRTVEEVISSREKIRIKDHVDHYLVCDKTGNCIAIEFLNGEEIYHTGDNLPVKVLANNSYLESMNAYERWKVEGDSFMIDDPKLLRFIKAAERVAVSQTVEKKSAIEYAFDVLEAVCGQKMSGSPTHWSIVYDTKNKQISFRTSTHSDIRRIKFSGLDFSQNGTVKLLDIHEKISGDITKRFREYSSEYQLEHALKAGKKWGSNPRLIEKDVKYMERFL